MRTTEVSLQLQFAKFAVYEPLGLRALRGRVGLMITDGCCTTEAVSCTNVGPRLMTIMAWQPLLPVDHIEHKTDKK